MTLFVSKLWAIPLLIICFINVSTVKADTQTEVGLYRTFEHSVVNNGTYSNKFVDVDLTCIFTSPSGAQTHFFGFFDGDGNGGGDRYTGNVWKFRFMPDELGEWNYSWSWSDSTPGGQGTFDCVTDNAGKGILRAYENNPRWFAYNGTEPVFLKSYYETGHGAIAQPFDWIKTNVYQPMLDYGYNHLQVNWLLPLCCDQQWYHDGPDKSIDTIRLYDEGDAMGTMQLNIWHMMEEHVQWLNDRNVGLHMFLGFNGGKNDGPDWKALSNSQQEFYVKYVVARLAPYANIAGWNYVWETDGDDASGDLELAGLLQQYDIFDHLRTYEDQFPASNEYDRPEYTFAAVENHGFSGKDEWGRAWTNHEGSLAGYVTGKPVYMSEGNALWRRYWHKKINEKYGTVDQNDLRQSAWACVTAGASFCWNGHAGEDSLVAFGPEGLPFYNSANPYMDSTLYIDILTYVMENEVVFYRMVPSDNLLSDHDSQKVWCLAEPGQQYLVFSTGGSPFNLQLAEGQYVSNIWMDTKTSDSESIPYISSSNQIFSFNPPDTSTDWILLIRSGPPEPDDEPPTPDPMTWEVAPHSIGGVDIAMEATTATDISGVMYYFANLTDPNHDSGWVSSPSWTDANLETATTYSYSVIARDNSPNQNTTGWSDVNSATTDPWACTAPIDVDLSGDCLVNMIDYAILAAAWTGGPYIPELIINGEFDTDISSWYFKTLSSAKGVMTAVFDGVTGDPAGSALVETDTGTTGANDHRFYQVIPVTVGKEYVFSGNWAGDISGTIATNPDARNWAEVFIGFTDTTTPDGSDFGSIIYKKAYGNGNQHTTTGIWDWEPITDSPDGSSGDTFTATAPYMCVSFNLGGRANSGTTYFWVDNISVTENQPCAEIDLNDDCQLNFQDLALLTDAWLICNRDPASECWP